MTPALAILDRSVKAASSQSRTLYSLLMTLPPPCSSAQQSKTYLHSIKLPILCSHCLGNLCAHICQPLHGIFVGQPQTGPSVVAGRSGRFPSRGGAGAHLGGGQHTHRKHASEPGPSGSGSPRRHQQRRLGQAAGALWPQGPGEHASPGDMLSLRHSSTF